MVLIFAHTLGTFPASIQNMMGATMTEGANSIAAVLQTNGRQVRMYRQLAGMTQDDLAARCGIYRTYLSRLENGQANPTLSVLRALAATLDVELWQLISEPVGTVQPGAPKLPSRVTK